MGAIIPKAKLQWLRKNCIVLVHGVYDLLTPAHFRHLVFAKERGEVLVVSITGDDYVNKEFDRPYFTAQWRAEVLSNIACVDYVVINNDPDAVSVIQTLRPDIYVKGLDTLRTPGEAFDRECKAVENCGGQVIYSPNSYEAHTTDVVNAIRSQPQ